MGGLKQFAWFLVKSPQRKIIGYKTWITDLKACLKWVFYPKPKAPLSICVGVFNKWEELFNNVIPSLLKTKQAHTFELCISDSGSEQAQKNIQKLKSLWPYALKIEVFEQPFTRASVFNRAIKLATNPWILVLDADMQVPTNMLLEYRQNVRKGKAWFPICQWQLEKNSLQWRWFTEGTGIFGAHITDFYKVGQLNKKYTTWGLEDWDLFFAFYKNGIAAHRTNCKNLIHQWHPSLKPTDFKKWF